MTGDGRLPGTGGASGDRAEARRALFTGKERESATAKYQRYRLKERVCHRGAEPDRGHLPPASQRMARIVLMGFVVSLGPEASA